MDKTYIEIVRLLLESTPAIFETPHFGMKGGTAINLFIEDMPRLSVDIDVVYTDHQDSRDEALKSISKGLEAVRKRLAKAGLEADVSATKDGDEIKLFIRRGRKQVKVEVNHVFRGTVLPVETRQLGNEARKLFTTELSLPVLATSELYGSKLVAAMDRQHPNVEEHLGEFVLGFAYEVRKSLEGGRETKHFWTGRERVKLKRHRNSAWHRSPSFFGRSIGFRMNIGPSKRWFARRPGNWGVPLRASARKKLGRIQMVNAAR